MRLARILFLRLRSLMRSGRVERELEQEIQLHLDALTAELRASGLSEADARREARRQFGAPEAAKDECRDERRVNLAAEFVRDVRYTLRGFRRSPGFALTAIVSLALGLGANAVVFSAINSLLLRGLTGVPEPERIWAVDHADSPAHSFPAYRDIRDRSTVFAGLAAYRIQHLALMQEPAGAVRLWGVLATGNYFETLGVRPAMGRFFTPEEDREPNAHPVAVLSHDCWQSRFAGDPNIAGREIRLSGRPYRVVGVAPRGFQGSEAFFWPEIWVPMAMQAAVEGRSTLESRSNNNVWVAGRLKRGVTVEQARENLHAIAAQLGREHRIHADLRLGLSRPGLAGGMGRQAVAAFTGGVMLLALLVLGAACLNLTGLQTARGLDRARELAIRLSIGAGRGRLVRQLITESVVLSLFGAVAGLAGALLIARGVSQWQPIADFPVRLDIGADWRVLAVGLVTALVAGAAVGLGVARRAWSTDPALAVKGGGLLPAPATARAMGWRRSLSLQDAVLPVQIALCCLLVTASFAAARGLAASLDGPLGLRPDGLAILSYDLHAAGYDATRGARFHQRIQEEASRLPGVESAAYGNSVPLSPDHSTTTIYPEGTIEFAGRHGVPASYYSVSPGFFATLGTRLEWGREFDWHDGPEAPRVAIVNRTLARRLGDARRFLAGPGNPPVEVVGIVEDGKYQTLTEEPRAVVFYPVMQRRSQEIMLLARSAKRPAADVAADLRRVMAGADASVAAVPASYRQMMGLVYLPMRAAAVALGVFGLLALMLAVTGIYGAASHNVARRTKEIGIRMALGSRPGQTLRFVFTRLSMLVAVGRRPDSGWRQGARSFGRR